MSASADEQAPYPMEKAGQMLVHRPAPILVAMPWAWFSPDAETELPCSAVDAR